MAKRSGYRVRVEYFVPCDHSNLSGMQGVLTGIEKLKNIPEGAPAGTVIESFKAKPGRADG